MSDPLERAIERGTQRRLLSEIADLRNKLAQTEAREAELEEYKRAAETCIFRHVAALSTARAEAAQWLEMSERHCRRQEAAEAEAEAMREALDQTILWLRRNASAEQENKSRSAFIEAHNAALKIKSAALQAHRLHGEEK